MYVKNIEVEVLQKWTTLDVTCLESIASILELTFYEAEEGNQYYLLNLIMKYSKKTEESEN